MALELVSVGVNHYRSDRYVDLKNAVRDAARVAAYFENSLPAGSRFHTRLGGTRRLFATAIAH